MNSLLLIETEILSGLIAPFFRFVSPSFFLSIFHTAQKAQAKSTRTGKLIRQKSLYFSPPHLDIFRINGSITSLLILEKSYIANDSVSEESILCHT
jgi:hypothetical protein